MSRFGTFEQMVAYSEHLYCIWPDGLVTEGRTRPTREELIAGFMSIPEYTMARRTDGKPGYEAISGPTYASRERAERAVDPYCLPEEKQAA